MKCKRLLAFFLALCLTATLLPTAVRAETVVASGTYSYNEEISWVLTEDGTLTVTGSGPINGYDQPWWGYVYQITSIVIGEGITEIGSEAFKGCSELTELTLPAGLEKIGFAAFSNCGKLTDVHIPEGVAVIEQYAFHCCDDMKVLTIPDSVESIRKGTFYSCTSLEAVTIPARVKYIDPDAFACCYGLKSIRFLGNAPQTSDSVFRLAEATIQYPVFNASWTTEAMQRIAKDAEITWVGLDLDGNPYKPGYEVVNRGIRESEDAWILTSDGTLAVFDAGILNGYYTHTAWYDYAAQVKNLVIMDGIDIIWSSEFNFHANMTSVSIPDSVTAIENWAFAYCYSLTSITIPAGVQEMANNVFTDCTALEYVYFEGDAPKMDAKLFQGANTTCVYPADNPTWTEDVLQDYGGTIIWISSDKAHIHEYVSVVTEPTCLEKGYTTHTCTICGRSYVDSYVDPAGHNWVHTVVPPTCADGGYTEYTCSWCGRSYWDDYTDALGHDYVEETTPATCDLPGCTVYTCTVCGHSYEEVSEDPLGHTYDAVVTPPTCTEEGYTTYTCTRCSNSYKADYTYMLYHDYTAVEKPATCTEGGCTVFTCDRCGYSYETNITYPLEHDYEVVVTEPGIGQPGYTTYTCRRCGDSYQDDFHDAFIRVDVLEGDNGQWNDQDYGSLVFCVDANAEDLTDINVDGFELYDEEFTAVGNPAVITLNPVFFSRMGEGEHTLEIFFGNGLATATFTVIRTPEEESYIDWSFSNGTLTITGYGKMDDYYDAPWAEYKDRIKAVIIDEGITYVGQRAFYEYTNLSSVSLPSTLHTVGHVAFYGCSALTTIDIPYGVTTIDDTAFAYCSNLTTISIPATVTSMGDYTFEGCSSLTSIVIPEGVTEIGEGIFGMCSSLTTVSVPDSVQSIGKYAFMSCSSLKEIYIPEGVTCLGDNVFFGCNSLAAVHMPSTITRIETAAFVGCYTLTDIDIPYGVTYIGELAFSGSSGISSVVIPATVTYIGEQAFSACWSLSTITFQGDAPTFDGTRIFERVAATAYYPKDNHTWTSDVRKSYGASYLKWSGIDLCEMGHSYVTVVVEPTCTEGGSTTYTCTVCGDSYVEEFAPLGHDYETVVTEPTCTEGGLTTHICTRCADYYEEDRTEALGHSYESRVTEPTFETEGYTTYTCVRCGHSYVADQVPALIPYAMLEGDGAVWNGEESTGLYFRAEGDISDFTGVRIDGRVIAPSRYTVTEGSTVITLDDAFVLLLANGEHTLEILFRDGKAVASFTVENNPVLLGDVDGNGEVDTTDAYLIVMYYNEKSDLDENQLLAADVDGSGEVDTTDAYYIVMYYNEKIDSFPAQQ